MTMMMIRVDHTVGQMWRMDLAFLTIYRVLEAELQQNEYRAVALPENLEA